MNAIVCWTAVDGTPLLLRPVHPDDAEALGRLYSSLSPEDRRMRFHGYVNGLTPARLRLMTDVDPRREDAFIIAALDADGESLLADARLVLDEDGESAECALVVGPAWRGIGLGERCIRTLCTAAAERGLRRLHGSILADNAPMIALLQRCGFHCATNRYDARFVLAERAIAAPIVPSKGSSVVPFGRAAAGQGGVGTDWGLTICS
jgi:acetyltransferase